MVSSYIGCITGTSVDGLDIALLDIADQGAIQVRATHTASIDPALRHELLELGMPGGGSVETANAATHPSEIDRMGHADAALGAWIGREILAFLKREGRPPESITAIGSHGQTIRHRPPGGANTAGAHPFTLQIGDPNQIAEITGITTVADFRRRDMAAGGHGAPLVPPFHRALFGHAESKETEHSASVAPLVLNIGGISNVSVFGRQTFGFDTGPGNALMDAWCGQHLDQAYDADGRWARSGEVDPALLESCLADEYFTQAPPKSTGREYFNLEWLRPKLQAQPAPLAEADVQATLCLLTARTVADAITRWASETTEVIVCGGGRLNAYLMDLLARESKRLVRPSEEVGVDGDSVESAAFAWLAYRTLEGLSGNEPAVTGAAGPRILGAIYPGA